VSSKHIAAVLGGAFACCAGAQEFTKPEQCVPGIKVEHRNGSVGTMVGYESHGLCRVQMADGKVERWMFEMVGMRALETLVPHGTAGGTTARPGDELAQAGQSALRTYRAGSPRRLRAFTACDPGLALALGLGLDWLWRRALGAQVEPPR
jgi:hypothetical protein